MDAGAPRTGTSQTGSDSPDAMSDENLLRLHVAGDDDSLRDVADDAFRELMERHQAWVWRYLLNRTRSHDVASDLSQEVFLRVARGAAGFRHGARFTTWLFTITQNVFRKHLARKRRERLRLAIAAPIASFAVRLAGGGLDGNDGHGGVSNGGNSGADPLEQVADERPGPDREAQGREDIARLRAALADLPEKQRRVLLLVKVEGFSLDECSRTLEMKLGTVKTCLHRGRLKLARAMAVAPEGVTS